MAQESLALPAFACCAGQRLERLLDVWIGGVQKKRNLEYSREYRGVLWNCLGALIWNITIFKRFRQFHPARFGISIVNAAAQTISWYCEQVHNETFNQEIHETCVPRPFLLVASDCFAP